MMSPAVMPIAVVIAIVVFIWLQRSQAARGDGSAPAPDAPADPATAADLPDEGRG